MYSYSGPARRRILAYSTARNTDAATSQDGRAILAETPVICIIDDDESVRVATRSLVRSLGFAAYTFESPEEFLHSPRVEDTSCLISDVRMPNMSGVELQSRLLALGRAIPIIFITAFPDETIRARALNAGAVAVLTKPFYGETLIKCIDSVLKRRVTR